MSDALIERLAALDTATLHESGATTTFNAAIRMLSGSQRLAGRALTVLCPAGDNLMIHVALTKAMPGDVLVVQCHDPDYGVWGEVMTVGAMSRGVAGLVLEGSVRDLAAIRALDFSVFASGTCLRGTSKTAIGDINIAVSCGGAVVWPGDYIVADESGIVVIKPDQASAVADRGEQRARNEAVTMKQLRGGQTTLQLLGLEGRYK
jgi:4-hydroxy-4-methyl-2-oxoglutarate aldolase